MRKGKAALRRIKEHQNDNGRGRLDDRKQWGGRRWQENIVYEVKRGGIKYGGSKAGVCP